MTPAGLSASRAERLNPSDTQKRSLPELPRLDKHPRWGRAAVQRFADALFRMRAEGKAMPDADDPSIARPLIDGYYADGLKDDNR